MSNQNRQATKSEMAHARRIIQDAYPDLTAVFGAHSSYGGYRAPRDHTISFRLRDSHGQFHSNVIWLMPDSLASLTVDEVRILVVRANGGKR